MSEELLVGAILLIIAAGLFFIGLPDKHGESPRFLQFEVAPVLYPPVIMIFLAGGIAELVTALLRMSH